MFNGVKIVAKILEMYSRNLDNCELVSLEVLEDGYISSMNIGNIQDIRIVVKDSNGKLLCGIVHIPK